MKLRPWLIPMSGALLASLWSFSALADADKVVIGDIDDMSGLYADIHGPGAVEVVKMAIADFGGSILGKPIELLTFDHQNKPDLGVQKFREWADRDGLTMVLGGANTGVGLAIAAAAKEKKVPFFAIGAAGASLTGKDCTPYTVHYAYDTTALGNGTATTILKEGGKTWFFLTADYAFGTQLQDAAARVVTANGGKVARLGARAARHFGFRLLSLAGAEFGRAGARPRQCRPRLLQLAEGGQRARRHQDDEAGRPARLHHRHPRARPGDRARALSHDRLVLGPQRQDPRLRQALLDKIGREPTMTQAAYYSATITYLNAVKAAGTTDADKVMDELHKMKIDDMFTDDGTIRADGLMEHAMYVMQVKKPSESKYPWDYYRVVQKMSGEQAFGKLADSTCPLVKK